MATTIEPAGFNPVFEDSRLVVLDKHPGVVTQGAQGGCNLLAQGKHYFAADLFPVHRLDAATSGLVVFAKTRAVAAELASFFAARQVQKIYLALSDKKPKQKQGTVTGDMAKVRDGNWALCRSRQNPAITRFFSFGEQGLPRLFVLNPLTGKTHQLRVTLKALGAPILGDARYGGSSADRLYLHAYQLRFTLGGTAYDFCVRPSLGQYFTGAVWQARIAQLGDPSALFYGI